MFRISKLFFSSDNHTAITALCGGMVANLTMIDVTDLIKALTPFAIFLTGYLLNKKIVKSNTNTDEKKSS